MADEVGCRPPGSETGEADGDEEAVASPEVSWWLSSSERDGREGKEKYEINPLVRAYEDLEGDTSAMEPNISALPPYQAYRVMGSSARYDTLYPLGGLLGPDTRKRATAMRQFQPRKRCHRIRS